jgi:hypothetical protein
MFDENTIGRRPTGHMRIATDCNFGGLERKYHCCSVFRLAKRSGRLQMVAIDPSEKA